MKLRVTILPLILFGLFGYTVYQADKTAVNGEIKPKEIVKEIEEDYHEVDDFMHTGTPEYKFNH